jgi:uncharacterized membrane protein YeiH
MAPPRRALIMRPFEQAFYAIADVSAAFVAAISGAQAARQHSLDLFGIYTVAYVTACVGGIFRDLAIGAVPPVGLSDWRYMTCAIVAGSIVAARGQILDRVRNSVLLFDAIGMGFYSVIGAQKALHYGANAMMAVLLGVSTAVGGGVARDILLNRVPVILQTEIYALAALAGAGIQVLGQFMGWSLFVTPWFAASVAIGIRLLALRYRWHLPTGKPTQQDGPGG